MSKLSFDKKKYDSYYYIWLLQCADSTQSAEGAALVSRFANGGGIGSLRERKRVKVTMQTYSRIYLLDAKTLENGRLPSCLQVYGWSPLLVGSYFWHTMRCENSRLQEYKLGSWACFPL